MFFKSQPSLVVHKLFASLHRSYDRVRGIAALLFLKGSTYSCLICGHSFRKFLPIGYRYDVLREKKIIGGGYRENVTCPYCGSIDRERLVYHFIKCHQLLHAGMRVLHIAPEKNIRQLFRQAGADHLSADLADPMVDIKMDIQDIPFAADHFDAIVCNHVLEHVTDDQQAMRELHRVLKPGGWAILQVPFSAVMEKTFEDPSITSRADRERVFGQPNHARIYGLDYPDRLRAAGFTVSKERTDPDTAIKYVLNPEEPVFFCRKAGPLV